MVIVELYHLGGHVLQAEPIEEFMPTSENVHSATNTLVIYKMTLMKYLKKEGLLTY